MKPTGPKETQNADFYKELPRINQNILVTMLKADTTFNTGIVDVSHEYEKMYGAPSVLYPNHYLAHTFNSFLNTSRIALVQNKISISPL